MPYYNGKYLTDREVERISNSLFGEELEEFRESLTSDNSRSNDFLNSAIIGAATGSTILGGVLGGSFLGGACGDELFDDE